MNAGSVKQGDRIVYAINGQEYNGVALGSASFGFHPGLQAPNFHLNLVYLNEGGTPIKIMGAPLLTSAASDEEISKIAIALPEPRPDSLAEARENILANPRTIGWRPYTEGELVKALKASLDKAQSQVVSQSAQITALQSQVSDRDAQLAAAKAEIEGLKEHSSNLSQHVADLVSAQVPVPDPEPVEVPVEAPAEVAVEPAAVEPAAGTDQA